MGGVPRQGRGSVRVRVRRRPGRIRQDQHRQRPDRPPRLGEVDRGERAHGSIRPRSASTTSSAWRSWSPRSPARRRSRSCTARWRIASSIGSVCEMPAVTKFFNGNPVLGTVGGGIDAFAGRPGRKRWAEIEAVIGRSWDNVVDAIDEIVTIPDVDEAASKKAEAELAEPAPEPEDDEETVERRRRAETSTTPTTRPMSRNRRSRRPRRGRGARQRRRLLAQGRHRPGADHDQRAARTTRCAAISTTSRSSWAATEESACSAPSGALARYLADEHDHDLSDLATYDDIRTAATDGSLQVNVSDDNVYVLTGIVDDLADGPDAIDRDQLELAVELLRDVGDYAEDTTVDETLDADQPLGRLVAHVLDPDTVRRPSAAVRQGRRAVGGAGGVRGIAAAARSSATARSLWGGEARTGRAHPRREAGCWSAGPSPRR